MATAIFYGAVAFLALSVAAAQAQGTDAGPPKAPAPVTAPAAPAATEPTPGKTFVVYGPGNLSCATYLNDRSSRINADGWILGFWTGLDIGNESGQQVGKSTDGRGLVGQVAAVCRVRPAEPLYKSVQQVFAELKSDGR